MFPGRNELECGPQIGLPLAGEARAVGAGGGSLARVLLPADRYAQMRNVWFLPSPPTLVRWMERAGFRDVRLADLNRTSVEEQRSTDWMQFDSLPDFLDPSDPSRTVEGYPSPLRAVLIATL